MTTSVAHITPSTRDLTQFISPNAGRQSSLYLVQDTTGEALQKFENDFARWEEEEIAALIVKTDFANDDERLKSFRSFLNVASDILSCPLIRMTELKTRDDILNSRGLGFDALITPLASLSDAQIQEYHTLARTLHFRLIFSVKTKNDLERIVSLSPKFLYIEETNAFTQSLTASSYWLIGPEGLQNQIQLKGIVYVR
jgi:hypothetical protein